MDPLDDIFSGMRVKSALYSRLKPTAPWGVSFVKSQLIRFGFVINGHCWLDTGQGHQPVKLTQGDCFIARPGILLTLRDNPASKSVPCEEVFANVEGQSAAFGGEGENADILCGYFRFDAAGAVPLLSLLPDIVVIPADAERSPLLQATLTMLAMETTHPHFGSTIMVSRLADILLVQAIRTHIACEQLTSGWMAALTDKKLGHVIRQIHEKIADAWTLENLATLAGMSRSAFAAYFKQVVGEPPMEYVTHWRMYRARCLLGHANLSLSTIATYVGYDSDITFGRAYKRCMGISPGQYRKTLNH